MQLIVIKINGNSNSPQFALLGKKQLQARFTTADWKRVRSQSRGRKVVVLLGTNEVVLTSATIPSKNKKQLLQAIPYALEDTLAEDIEDLHFSVHQDSSENNESKVAVINRNVLIKTIDLLKSKGITANYVLPEILTQKIEPDSWSIIYENIDNKITANVRLNQYNGFVCEQQMLDMFLTEPLEARAPKIVFSNTKAENLPEGLQALDTKYIEADVIEYQSTLSALPLNLLNNFVRHQQSSNINFKAWRPVGVLGCLLAGVWAGIFFWQNNQLKTQSQQLNSQIEQVYKETFPKGRIVDAAAQMSAALKTLKLNAGKTVESPLPLIADVGPLLNQFKDLDLNELRYQENQLTMTLESPNLTRLEKFKKDAAEKNNLKIDIKDSTTTSNKVKAVIIISPLPRNTAKTNTNIQGDS